MAMHLRKMIAAFLCAVLVTLAGCTPTEPQGEEGAGNEGGGTESGAAMGRYTEETLAYPDGMGLGMLQQVEDKSFRLMGQEATGNWVVFGSEDGCESWQRVEYPWLDGLYPYTVNGAAFTPEGGVYLIYGLTEEDLEWKDLESFEGEVDASEIGTRYFAYGDMDGLRQIPHGMGPFDPYATLLRSDNGKIIYHDFEGVGILDVESGTILDKIPVAEFPYSGVYTVYGDIYAISEGNTLNLYDLVTGEKLPSLTYDTDLVSWHNNSNIRDRRIAVSPDHQEILYTDPSGIYRMMADGVLTEVLVDGDQSSFGLPSLTTAGIFYHSDNSFTVLCYTSTYEMQLYRYAYNPDIPLKPTKELQVYSLQDNLTIREAVVGYQKTNPDVYIHYVVGMPGTGEITASDALRSLSTQMLAGNGPDILVLDGVPMDSYIKKDVLLDLRELVEPKVASGELAANVSQTYKQADGAYYGIPLRYIPLMMAGDNLDSVHDLASLAGWMEQRGGQPLSLPPEQVMERMYDAHAYRWLDEDGSWNSGAFAADLENMGKIAEMTEVFEHETNGAIDRQRGELTVVNNVYFLAGENRFTYGRMHSLMVMGLNGLEIVFEANGNGSVKPFPDADGGVFVPVSILGVNAGSAQTQLAMDFVAYCLGGDVQDSILQDGLPVNMESLRTSAKNPDKTGQLYRGRIQTIYRTNLADGGFEEEDLPWAWASDAFMDNLIDMVQDLEQPALNNAVLKQIVFQETAPYFAGEQSLEDTVAAVDQKVELYLLEKA